MKSQFVIDKTPSRESPIVKFWLEVDKDGDLSLIANGSKLLYIRADSGQLVRWVLDNPVDGLAYDHLGRIEVWEG